MGNLRVFAKISSGVFVHVNEHPDLFHIFIYSSDTFCIIGSIGWFFPAFVSGLSYPCIKLSCF